MATGRQDMKDLLEQYIDSVGVRATLDLIAEICNEKAEHVRTNWQDRVTARAWDKAASRVDALTAKIDV